MRISDVNALVIEFQKLAKEDMEAAAKKRDELFSLLLKRDKFYVLSEDDRSPIIQPIQEGSPERYIRIFTHKELAVQPNARIYNVTSLELCKLARHWFLRGVAGIIVNDGANWFMVPMPDVLSLFLHLVSDSDIDRADAEIIELYNNLKQGDYFRILVHDNVFCYYGHETQGEAWERADLVNLENAKGAVTTPGGITVSADRVAAVIKYLKGLDSDAVDYDTDTLALVPEPQKAEPPHQKSGVSVKEKLSSGISKITAKLPKPSKKAGKMAMIAGLVLLALIVVFALFPSGNSDLSKFNKALKSGNYSQGQTLYTDFSLAKQDKANAALSSHIKALTEQYAVGDITEAELSAHLSALQAFPSAADDVTAAAQVASQLSDSKQAYQAGKDAESVPNRLHLWKEVIEADTASWAPMSKDISTHESAYVGKMTSEAQSYVECGLYGKAYQVSQDLVYWYPNNIKVSSLANEMSQYAGFEVHDLPIELLGVRVSVPSFTNDVDLFISWKNISAKPIEKIVFFVTPYNEFGKEASTPFKAVDTKGYAPWEGPDSKIWGWAAAWNAPNIKSAVITSISVTFEGNVTRDFSIEKQ